jgi:hypothetical protein
MIQRFHIPIGAGEEANPHDTGDWVLYPDHIAEVSALRARLEKLKRLVLLVDKSVENVVMQSINITIWSEYCATFPDE